MSDIREKLRHQYFEKYYVQKLINAYKYDNFDEFISFLSEDSFYSGIWRFTNIKSPYSIKEALIDENKIIQETGEEREFRIVRLKEKNTISNLTGYISKGAYISTPCVFGLETQYINSRCPDSLTIIVLENETNRTIKRINVIPASCLEYDYEHNDIDYNINTRSLNITLNRSFSYQDFNLELDKAFEFIEKNKCALIMNSKNQSYVLAKIEEDTFE